MQFKPALLLALAFASGEALAATTSSSSSSKTTTTSSAKTTTTTSSSKTSSSKTSTKTTATPVPTPPCTEFYSYAQRGYKVTYDLDFVGRKSQYHQVKNRTAPNPVVHDTLAGDFQLCHAAQACADLAAEGSGGYIYLNWNLVNNGIWNCIASYEGFTYTADDEIYLDGQTAAYGFKESYVCNSHYSGCDSGVSGD